MFHSIVINLHSKCEKEQTKQHKNPLFDLLFVPHRLFSHLRTCIRVWEHMYVAR